MPKTGIIIDDDSLDEEFESNKRSKGLPPAVYHLLFTKQPTCCLPNNPPFPVVFPSH
jgi:hypothetical protein